MTRFSHFAAIGMVILCASACGPQTPATPVPLPIGTPREQLSRVLERYWDERIPVDDVLASQTLADSLDVEKRFLAQLEAIPRDMLDADGRLSYDIFKRQRETAIEGFTYPNELLPINPFGGMLFEFPAAAAQSAAVPMTAAQYEGWLRHADYYVRWTRQAIANMQEGVLRGYTEPRALIQRALPILERLATDVPSNVFYTPLRSLPQDMAAADRDRLRGSLRDAVQKKLLPATRELHDYLQHSYLPKARAGLGLAELPLGTAWYEYRVRRAVGAAALPADIHRIGLTEVERLKPRLKSLGETAAPSATGAAVSAAVPAPAAAMGPAPTPATMPSWSDVLLAYQDLGARVSANLPTLFAAAAPTPYEIRAADYILLPGTPLYYAPADPALHQSAVLYVNSLDIEPRPAVADFLAQAIPGRHYQNAIQQQRLDLPRFRRFDAEPAFVAGWGLYAALLGDELGVYSSDADRYQELNLAMRCAVALVIDTGLNSQGWTRTQSLEYLRAQMNIEQSEAERWIDAYAAMPGDALSCGMGALKFQALRAKAQQSLGERFDIQEFHNQLLRDGAMPLDMLDAKMNAWLEASQ
jgi:uncharacterized protein (DUF885 family)